MAYDARTLALAAATAFVCLNTAAADEIPAPSRGQTIYLPVYSHLWHGNLDAKNKVPETAPLSALISIRNTDPTQPIRIVSARYYDTKGSMLREFVPAARAIPPLGTLELFVERREAEGGSGANFLIRWQADTPVSPPITEAVHADLHSVRTVSFVTSGRAIRNE